MLKHLSILGATIMLCSLFMGFFRIEISGKNNQVLSDNMDEYGITDDEDEASDDTEIYACDISYGFSLFDLHKTSRNFGYSSKEECDDVEAYVDEIEYMVTKIYSEQMGVDLLAGSDKTLVLEMFCLRKFWALMIVPWVILASAVLMIVFSIFKKTIPQIALCVISLGSYAWLMFGAGDVLSIISVGCIALPIGILMCVAGAVFTKEKGK